MSDHAHHHHSDFKAGAKTATEPVCGMQFEMREDARTRDYGDETYWFCSESCETKFDADPWFYASGNADKADRNTQPGT